MVKVAEDEEREYRISMEVVVDANGPEEQAMGWYYYLSEKIEFPFRARCSSQRSISPLLKDEEVTIQAMAPEDDCMAEMFVMTRWMGRRLAVPLAQLQPVDVDPQTAEAVDDWIYWANRGYKLC
jgi:hypothetical protein